MQSRFLALVSNGDELRKNIENAENAEDVGTLQAIEALDSLESKINQVQVSYQQFYTSIGAENVWKGALDGIRNFIDSLNNLPKAFDKIPLGAIATLWNAIGLVRSILSRALVGLAQPLMSAMAQIRSETQAKSRATGEDVVENLKTGITSKQGELQNAGRQAGEAIQQGLKSGLNQNNNLQVNTQLNTFNQLSQGIPNIDIYNAANIQQAKDAYFNVLTQMQARGIEFSNDQMNTFTQIGDSIGTISNGSLVTLQDALLRVRQALSDTGAEAQNTTNKTQSFFDKLGQQGSKASSTIVSIARSLNMVAMMLDKNNEKMRVTAGLMNTLSGFLQGGVGIAQAMSGNWVQAIPNIAAGLINIFNGISIINENDSEKMERLTKQATEASNAAKQAKADSSQLQTAIDNLKELKKHQYDSEEAAEEYKKAMADLGDQYPHLIKGFDSMGNAIVDAGEAEEYLALLRQKTAKATYEAAQEEYKKQEEANRQAKVRHNAAVGTYTTSDEYQAYMERTAPIFSRNVGREWRVWGVGTTDRSEKANKSVIDNWLNNYFGTTDIAEILSIMKELEDYRSKLGILSDEDNEKYDLLALMNIYGEQFDQYVEENPEYENVIKEIKNQSERNIDSDIADPFYELIFKLNNISISSEEKISYVHKYLTDLNKDIEQIQIDKPNEAWQNNDEYKKLHKRYLFLTQWIEDEQELLLGKKTQQANTKQLIAGKMLQMPDYYETFKDSAGIISFVTDSLTEKFQSIENLDEKLNDNTSPESKNFNKNIEAWSKFIESTKIFHLDELLNKILGNITNYNLDEIDEYFGNLDGYQDVSDDIHTSYTKKIEELRKNTLDYINQQGFSGEGINGLADYYQANIDEVTQADAIIYRALAESVGTAEDHGLLNMSQNLAAAGASFIATFNMLTEEQQRAISGLIEENGLLTKEAVQKTIDGLKELDIPENLIAEIESGLTYIQSTIIDSIALSVQTTIDNFIDGWSDNEKELKKVTGGFSIDEIDKFINRANKLDGIDFNLDNFYQQGDKFILSIEDQIAYIDAWFDKQTKDLGKKRTEIKNIKQKNLFSDYGEFLGFSDQEESSPLNAALLEDMKALSMNPSDFFQYDEESKTYTNQFVIGKTLDDFYKARNEAITQVEEDMDYLEATVLRAKEALVQSTYFTQGQYKKILSENQIDELKGKKGSNNFNQLTDASLYNAYKTLTDTTSSFISDLLSQGKENINPSEYKGLSGLVGELDLNGSYQEIVERYVQHAGKTLEESNQLIMQAIEKDNEKQISSIDALKDITQTNRGLFAKGDAIEKLATALGMNVSDLIGEYDTTLEAYHLKVTPDLINKLEGVQGAADLLADSFKSFLESLADTFEKALSGMTNSEVTDFKAQLVEFGLDPDYVNNLNFHETVNGLKLANDEAIKLYNRISQINSIAGQLIFDELVESLTSSREELANIGATMATITNVQNEIAKNESEIAALRKNGENESNRLKYLEHQNDVLREQLSLYQRIANVQSADPDSFDFMSRKLPDAMQGPVNYWNSIGKAYSAINEAGKTGYMEIADYYNIVNEMANLVQMSNGRFEWMGMTSENAIERMGTLIEAGFGSIKNIDAKGAKISMEGLAKNLQEGAINMSNGIDIGVKEMARGQIAMLDAAIQMLEAIVAMEQLGEIDTDQNGELEIGELFKIDDNGQISEYLNDDVQLAMKTMSEQEAVKELFQNIFIEQQSIYDLINDEEKLHQLSPEGAQELANFLNEMYQLYQSNDFDPANMQASVQKLIASSKLLSQAALNIYDADANIQVVAKPGAPAVIVDWSNWDEKSLQKIGLKTQEEAQELLEKYSRNQLDSGLEYEQVYRLLGKITIDENDNYVYNGQTYTKEDLPQLRKLIGNVESLGGDSGFFTGEENMVVKAHAGNLKYEVEIGVDGEKTFNIEGHEFVADNFDEAVEQYYHWTYDEGGELSSNAPTLREFKLQLTGEVQTEYELKGDLNKSPETQKQVREILTGGKDALQEALNGATDNEDGTLTVTIGDVQYVIPKGETNAENQENLKQAMLDSLGLNELTTQITTAITEAFKDASFTNAISEGLKTAFSGDVNGEVTLPEITLKPENLKINLADILPTLEGTPTDGAPIDEYTAALLKLILSFTGQPDTSGINFGSLGKDESTALEAPAMMAVLASLLLVANDTTLFNDQISLPNTDNLTAAQTLAVTLLSLFLQTGENTSILNKVITLSTGTEVTVAGLIKGIIQTVQGVAADGGATLSGDSTVNLADGSQITLNESVVAIINTVVGEGTATLDTNGIKINGKPISIESWDALISEVFAVWANGQNYNLEAVTPTQEDLTTEEKTLIVPIGNIEYQTKLSQGRQQFEQNVGISNGIIGFGKDQRYLLNQDETEIKPVRNKGSLEYTLGSIDTFKPNSEVLGYLGELTKYVGQGGTLTSIDTANLSNWGESLSSVQIPEEFINQLHDIEGINWEQVGTAGDLIQQIQELNHNNEINDPGLNTVATQIAEIATIDLSNVDTALQSILSSVQSLQGINWGIISAGLSSLVTTNTPNKLGYNPTPTQTPHVNRGADRVNENEGEIHEATVQEATIEGSTIEGTGIIINAEGAQITGTIQGNKEGEDKAPTTPTPQIQAVVSSSGSSGTKPTSTQTDSPTLDTSGVMSAIAIIQAGLSALGGQMATLGTSLARVRTAGATAASQMSTLASNISRLKSKSLKISATIAGTIKAKITATISATGGITSTTEINKELNTQTGSAKGNVALAKGIAAAKGVKSTLMGELGPELVVANGRYYTVGNNGAEFVDLPKDAIVFNHQQTARLLKNKKVNGRGNAINGDKAAISFAKGTEGPAMASAAAALSQLKQIRAMWQALLNASAKDMGSKGGGSGGGGGGGGGGNGPDPGYIHDLEIWYNLLKQIDKLEKDISYQEALQAKIQNDKNGSGEALYASYKENLNLLEQEVAKNQELASLQEDMYKKFAKEFSGGVGGLIYTFTDDGLVQYNNNLTDFIKASKDKMHGVDQKAIDRGIFSFSSTYTKYERDEAGELKRDKSGNVKSSTANVALEFDLKGASGLDILSYINAIDPNTGKARFTADEQYAILEGLGFSDWLKVNSSGEDIDKNKEGVEAFWEKLDGSREEFESLFESYREQQQKVLENQQKINELIKTLQDNQIEVENAILTAIEERQQKEIDLLEDEKDALEKATESFIDGLNEQLEREQQMYQDQQTDQELTRMQRQLAILQRSGGSASQIRSLQDQITSKQQDRYFNAQKEQIDAVQQASDKQIERLDNQIELMKETLEYQKENGLFWPEVTEIMQHSPEYIVDFIQTYTPDYRSKSEEQIAQDLSEIKQKVGTWTSERDDPDAIRKQATTEADKAWLAAKQSGLAYDKEVWDAVGDEAQKAFIKTYLNGDKNGVGKQDTNVATRAAKDILDAEVAKRSKKKDDGDKTEAPQYESTTLKTHKAISNAYKSIDESGTGHDKDPAITAGAEDPIKVKAVWTNKNDELKYWGIETSSGAQGWLKKDMIDTSKVPNWKKLKIFKATATTKFKTGGLVNFTGPAWLDGTRTKPEAVLNAKQTKFFREDFWQQVEATRNELKRFMAQNAIIKSQANAVDNNPTIIIENANVNMNVEQMANDYDARTAANTVMNEMVRIARRSGNRSLSRR